jgi:hypothetical protein
MGSTPLPAETDKESVMKSNATKLAMATATATATAAFLIADLAACGGSTGASIPDYQPSTVLTKSPYSTVLESPDSVSQVGAFYEGALKKDGWDIGSKSSSSYHASFTAHRTGEGASISVYPRESGSGISINTHPE